MQRNECTTRSMRSFHGSIVEGNTLLVRETSQQFWKGLIKTQVIFSSLIYQLLAGSLAFIENCLNFGSFISMLGFLTSLPKSKSGCNCTCMVSWWNSFLALINTVLKTNSFSITICFISWVTFVYTGNHVLVCTRLHWSASKVQSSISSGVFLLPGSLRDTQPS